MKCDEVQTMHDPYLDSELDARTSLEIELHLKACPNCARLFAEEERLEARIKAGLNQGQRTAALWEQIERSVAAAAPSAARPRVSPSSLRPATWQVLWSALQAGWQRSPQAWAGLSAAWVVILALNFAAREPDAPFAARQDLPSASEMRFALKQKQLLMADLAALAEPAPADKVKVAPPSPRSDRRNETLNT